jgi:hypothetical protein
MNTERRQRKKKMRASNGMSMEGGDVILGANAGAPGAGVTNNVPRAGGMTLDEAAAVRGVGNVGKQKPAWQQR